MKKAYKIINTVSTVVAFCLVLVVTGTYATWYYVQGRLPDNKTANMGIGFIFPIPTNGLSFNTLPSTSDNLWGAMDENGNTSSTDAKKHLLKDYTPFDVPVNNQTDLTEAKCAIIRFEIIFCLSTSLISDGWIIKAQYPFEDPYTISRNGEIIGRGNIFFPATKSDGTATSGNVELTKVSDTAVYQNNILAYKYYTASIDPREIDGFDVSKFIVAPGEEATFVLTVEHTQTNTAACFASIKVIAEEYPTPTA